MRGRPQLLHGSTCQAMHEVLGARPSIDPPVVVASFVEEDPTTILMVNIKLTVHNRFEVRNCVLIIIL